MKLNIRGLLDLKQWQLTQLEEELFADEPGLSKQTIEEAIDFTKFEIKSINEAMTMTLEIESQGLVN